MISLFVALCLLTSVKPSNNKELQVQKVKCGESVTIKCDLSSDNDLIWYKQDYEKVPQMVVRRVQSQIRDSEGFTDGRFSISDKNQFILTIKDLKEEDTGTYFCAEVLKSSQIFGSGTRLIVEAEEMKRLPPTVTLMENRDVKGAGYRSTDQMHVFFLLSIIRVGVLTFMLIIFTVILKVVKLR